MITLYEQLQNMSPQIKAGYEQNLIDLRRKMPTISDGQRKKWAYEQAWDSWNRTPYQPTTQPQTRNVYGGMSQSVSRTIPSVSEKATNPDIPTIPGISQRQVASGIGEKSSGFLTTLRQSIQDIDPEKRENYLNGILNEIKSKMANYDFRLSRGIPLTSEQQQEYNSLASSLKETQSYMNSIGT